MRPTAAAVFGLAGGDGGGGTPTEGNGEVGEVLPAGASEEAFVHGPVPADHGTASSQAGEARTPDDLRTKEQVQEAGHADGEEQGR